jgi:hypothetical protein
MGGRERRVNSVSVKFSVIGLENSLIFSKLIQRLVSENTPPEYVVIVEKNPSNIASSNVFIDQGVFPEPGAYHSVLETGLVAEACIRLGVSMFFVSSQSGDEMQQILKYYPVDILLKVDNFNIRGPVLYLPKMFVLGVNATIIPPKDGIVPEQESEIFIRVLRVSTYVVTPWVNEETVIRLGYYKVAGIDSQSEVEEQILNKTLDLAVDTLKELELNEEQRMRISREEISFYDK